MIINWPPDDQSVSQSVTEVMKTAVEVADKEMPPGTFRTSKHHHQQQLMNQPWASGLLLPRPKRQISLPCTPPRLLMAVKIRTISCGCGGTFTIATSREETQSAEISVVGIADHGLPLETLSKQSLKRSGNHLLD